MAVLFMSDPNPSAPFMNVWLRSLGLGLEQDDKLRRHRSLLTLDGPVSAAHHVDPVSVRGWSLPDEVTVHSSPARVGEVVVPAVIPLSLVLHTGVTPGHSPTLLTHLVEHHVLLLGGSRLAGGGQEQEAEGSRQVHLEIWCSLDLLAHSHSAHSH